MPDSSVVVVTGASSGIGRAAAELFAARGCRMFGTVRDLHKAPALPGVEFIEMDVRNEDSVQAAVEAIIDKTMRIDVLVNNAGMMMTGAVEETATAEAAALFDTNVFGILRMTRAVLPSMRAYRRGRIVNVSSVLGVLPAPYMAMYVATKHAVEGLSESLDHEVRQFGIRATLVQPAFTRTNLDANALRAKARIDAYDLERDRVASSVSEIVRYAPGPRAVARTIVEAALGPWRMQFVPPGQASLLMKLRRFLPAGTVDARLRKTLGIAE